jgi:hypothetical protein
MPLHRPSLPQESIRRAALWTKRVQHDVNMPGFAYSTRVGGAVY